METAQKTAAEEPAVPKRWSCWTSLCFGFETKEDEKLYYAYTQAQRMRCVPRLFAFGVALQLYSAFVPGDGDCIFAYGAAVLTLFINIVLLIIYAFERKSRIYICYVIHAALWVQLLYNEQRRHTDTYNELLGWAAVLLYLCIASLPFPVAYHIFNSIITILGYTLVQYAVSCSKGARPEDFVYQMGVNVALLSGSALLGLVCYLVRDRQQRSSYLETKRSLGDKLTIEQQSKEQERLLLSVLPEHVAVQMRKELGLIDTQFKKIYMSRHENVSILYADIVGFTAISSTYSAQDLVSILNELFARFDRLAEKYQQLRIKILGDCYYCISGAPVERPDHAVLCVHMGLSMVKAIKYVQQTTNSPVDMRVGIHTGAVLAGVLGQRQWQFDVYSRDVELANKMESSGKAGRVHISEVTLSYLNDEFEVEPAHGERREEMLRQAGIKTYFIVKVLKPFAGAEDKYAAEDGEEAPDTLSDLRDDDEDSVLSPQDEKECDEKRKIYTMLKEELVNRDDDKELADATTVWLTFKSPEAEAAYNARATPCPPLSLTPTLLIVPSLAMLYGFAAPGGYPLNGSYLVLLVEIVVLNILYLVYFNRGTKKAVNRNPNFTMAAGVIQIAMLAGGNITPLVICGHFESLLNDGLTKDALSHQGARRCEYSSYFYHLAVGLMIAMMWVSPLSTGARATLLFLVAACHSLPPLLSADLMYIPQYNPYDQPNASSAYYNDDFMKVIVSLHYGRHIVMLALLFVVLVIYDRYVDSQERARHSRGERMRQQAEQAADLRRRNQALIHNVLPPHVASHFMGARHHHRDLYSQSYAEVGVLFASMPNFSEFYSEETVNNQGLECLRFLNEVISDFDLLLEDPKYCNDIIKIKTISSSYMAASGLNPKQQIKPGDGVLVRWEHLANLVEFALELQAVLAAINEQSFNHFVLRLGVNHGPITAGVIGARKPHYDIWGNTVNVASRMESTGKAGCIQVTEETCRILENFGYTFEQRGLVAVKGKGQLMTYYLQGRSTSPRVHDRADKPACNPEAKEGSAVNGAASGAARAALPSQPDGADRCLLDMV